jgi:hypothetical protein
MVMQTPGDAGLSPRHDRIDAEQRLPCPQCNRGLRDAAVSFRYTSGGGWVAHCHRCGWKAGQRSQDRTPAAIAPRDTPSIAAGLARPWARFWRECAPIRGTVGETYLRTRGCALPPLDGDLRFHPRAFHWIEKARAPALVALASDALSRDPRTLHFTFLADDGRSKAQLNPPRLLLARHEKAGAVIRLWPDEAVSVALGLAEGIESALSLAHAGLPVWAAIDAGNLGELPVLGGIEEVAIAVDRDPAGERAADALAHRYVTAGRRVRLVKPKAGDLNDVAVGTYGA